ncbi:MAG: hypothetical protein ACI3WU_01320 [Phascolarctobacterium sp.]
MPSTFYKCPHAQFVEQRLCEGLLIYYHEDGSPCDLLNNLQVTPERILLEQCQQALRERNLLRYGDAVAQNAYDFTKIRSRDTRLAGELQLLLLGFHNSPMVRQNIYVSLEKSVQRDSKAVFWTLCQLLCFFFAQQYYQEALKEYQGKVRELVYVLGEALEPVLQQLGMQALSSDSYKFYHEAVFAKRFEYHPKPEQRERNAVLAAFAKNVLESI